MAFATSIPDPQNIRIVNISSLAVLLPLIDQLNIASIIDRHLPTEAEVSHGNVLAILLAARLQSPTALVNIEQWAQQHGVEFLYNVPPEKLNDDRLGRALDAFFEERLSILAEVTHEVLRLTQLRPERCHFDTTHLVFYGSYEDSKPRPHSELDRLISDIAMSPAHIAHGYLTKYKMLQLGITSVADDLGAVPVGCHLFDGNRNGHTGIAQQYHLLRNYLDLPDGMLLVSDRGTCSAEHLARLRQHGHYALCTAPWQDYRGLFDQHAASLNWQPASFQSLEQQRRRKCHSSLPLEEYRLAVLDHQLINPLDKQPFDCRMIFVHSSAAAKESKQRREKNITKIKAGLETIALRLQEAHPATTTGSAERAIKKLLGKKDAARHFQWHIEALSETEMAALPDPRKGYRKQAHRLVWTFDATSAQADERHDGVYAMVTTAPSSWSGDALFTQYKRQTHVERGHHELKTPLAVTPIFLKTESRVEALVSLLFLALQAQMTLERQYRRTVPATAPLSERQMTAERILRSFRVCGIAVRQESYGEVVSASRLTAEQRDILMRLGLSTPTQILRQTLAAPPSP